MQSVVYIPQGKGCVSFLSGAVASFDLFTEYEKLYVVLYFVLFGT